MDILNSILGLGQFKISVDDILGDKKFLTKKDIDNALTQNSGYFQNFYLSIVTGFAHRYDLQVDVSSSTQFLCIEPPSNLARFIFGLAGFMYLVACLMLRFGNVNGASLQLLTLLLLLLPLLAFGLPSLFGWLYFRFCISKLRKLKVN